MVRDIDLLRADAAIASVVGYTGNRTTNRGMSFVDLKPLSERSETADQVIDRLRPASTANRVGGSILSDPGLSRRGRSSSAQFQYTLYSESIEDLRVWEPRLRQALANVPQIADVNTDAEARASRPD